MNAPSYFLNDILASIQYLEQFTTEGRNAFLADKKTQLAVMYVYEVIGDAVKRLPADLLATQPHIDWRGLTQFGEFLVNNYDRIDLTEIWSHIEDLPTLRASVEALLNGWDEEQN